MFASGRLLADWGWTGPNGRTAIRVFGRSAPRRKGRLTRPDYLNLWVPVLEGPPANRATLPAVPAGSDVALKLSSKSIVITGIEVINTYPRTDSSRFRRLQLSSLIAVIRDGMLGGEHLIFTFGGPLHSVHAMGGGVKNKWGEYRAVWRGEFGHRAGKKSEYSPEELEDLVKQTLRELKKINPHKRKGLKTPVGTRIGTSYRQLQAWLKAYQIDFDAAVDAIFDEEKN